MFAKISFFLCIAFLPCLWADDIKNIQCPDGKECPFGKTCELSNDTFECYELSEEDQQNKELISGLLSVSTSSVSEVFNDPGNGTCPGGTICHNNTCCGAFQNAVCCDGVNYCCPNSAKCCSVNETNWCCMANTRCHNVYGYCVSGVPALSPTAICLIMILFMCTSKNFF